MMSVIHQGVYIYFQTNKCYIKSEQIKLNQMISLSCGNVSIEGTAKEIGDWTNQDNQELKQLYQKIHPSSFEAYGLLEGQVVYMIIPKKVKIWKYIEGTPIREYIDFINNTAEQLEFM